MGPQQAPVARQVPVVRVMVLPAVHQVPAAPVVLVAAVEVVVARRLFLVVHPGVRHPVNLDKIMKRSLYAAFFIGVRTTGLRLLRGSRQLVCRLLLRVRPLR